jgi:hypothetical protein
MQIADMGTISKIATIILIVWAGLNGIVGLTALITSMVKWYKEEVKHK